MIVRVQVSPRSDLLDARGESLRAALVDFGMPSAEAVRVSSLYFLDLDEDADPRRIIETLLGDPIAERTSWHELPRGGTATALPPGRTVVEVVPRPGVTDSVAASLLEGAAMVGLTGLRRAAHGARYEIEGALDAEQIRAIAEGLLANPVIHTHAIDALVEPPFLPVQRTDPAVETVPLCQADDAALEAISQARRLALDLGEMRAIRDHFRTAGREPTDVEIEMIAQTWSEHCSHKTMRALIDYREWDVEGRERDDRRVTIDSLLETFIVAATTEAAKPWVRSAFVDNAGIVELDDEYDLAFKVETHNHPSALEPFGGANTGIGGVVRDVMGVSARPIATTDVLCFGPPELRFAELPKGVLHPRRIAEGVVAGVADYGNKMGIPTVDGAVLYDECYAANPLVYCGCLGILPRGSHPTKPAADDLVVLLGGRTGRDGLRGATFSSMAMTRDTARVAGSAVQIGDPIEEKKLVDALLPARDEQLYSAITDCGAGGLSSAVGELAAHAGADIQLDRVPLKYQGLRPWEIWLSEAQERMVVAVPPRCWPRLRDLCTRHGVEATPIGRFTGDRLVTVRFGDQVVCNLPTALLFDEQPRRRRVAHWQPPRVEEPALPCVENLTAELLALLASPDIRSKEEIVRRYDHEVQAGTWRRPFAGVCNDGPSDGAVVVPLETLRRRDRVPHRAVALAVGIQPAYGAFDPYAMAWASVDEALRNAVALGAAPDRIALLDNFCWGSPERPEELGKLVQCVRGMCDAARAFGLPFVSGKDSLYNEYRTAEDCVTAIQGTLLVSALGVVPDVRLVPGSDLKRAADPIYVLGLTREELGGSAWYRARALQSARVPRPVPEARATLEALHRALAAGIVRACHDCSEGGLGVALAEMCVGGRRGARVDLGAVPQGPGPLDPSVLLFSESLGRFVVCTPPERAADLEQLLTTAGVPHARVGEVSDDEIVEAKSRAGLVVVHTTVERLGRAWRGHVARRPSVGDPRQPARGKPARDGLPTAEPAPTEQPPSRERT